MMFENMLRVKDIRKLFLEEYHKNNFVKDKNGTDIIELIGISYIPDEPVIFGKLNEDYAKRELKWYKTQSLSINDIPGEIPTIWKNIADKNNLINSNYGWCIYSKENHFQLENCINELKNNIDSRRALMIYNRPSMWEDYNKDGKDDFICTTSVQLLVRDCKLYYIINQRSCDVVFGYKNDIYWHKHVYDEVLNKLNNFYDIQRGEIIHQVGSLHLYSRHFYLLNKID